MSQVKKSAGAKKTGAAGKHGVRRLLATGFSMGTADLVPGVSGGTIAFLFGIYEELLYSIKTVTGTTLKLLLKGQFKAAYRSVPWHFLVPLFIGIVAAIFGLASVITYLLDNHDVFVWAFFFGLVLGSAFVVRKRVSHWNAARIALLIVGAVATYFLVGIASAQIGSGPFSLFIAGAIAFCALILPGISGSLFLVVLGKYETIIGAAANFNLPPLLFLAAGGAVGLALFSRVLTWLFRHYYGAMVAFLTGVMLGSLRQIWPWDQGGAHQQTNVLPPLDWTLLLAIVLAIAGFVVVLQLEKFGITKEHDEDIGDKAFKKEYREAERSS